MARPAIDQLSQEQLIFELRRWIDAARFHTDSRSYGTAVGEILGLVSRNPTSVLRSHVLHNLGGRRRSWLSQLAANLPNMPVRETLEKMA